jgi:hypothetical protein
MGRKRKRDIVSHTETPMRSFLFASILVASVAAVPLAQSAPARANSRPASDTARVGTYDLEITTDDGTLVGSLSLKRASDALVAELTAGGMRPAIKSFVREGNSYVLTGGHGEFVVTYTLKFADDSVTGSLKMSTGLTGTVAGARKK